MLKKQILVTFAFCCTTLLLSEQVPAQHWNAENYSQNGLLQYQWAKQFFFDHYTWSGYEQVLDIGCGDGRLTHLISQHAPHGKILGIDCSPSMITHASQHYSMNHLCFEQEDAANPHFYECFPNAFDLIVSFHCLHWIEDQTTVLQGIKTALKPQGKAFLRLSSKGWDPIQEIADALIQSPQWQPLFVTFKDPMHRYDIPEYLTLIHTAGLEPVRIEEVILDDVLPNEERLALQIQSWLPHLTHLPTQLRPAFLNDIVSTYLLQTPPYPDGSIHLYDSYLEIEIRPK